MVRPPRIIHIEGIYFNLAIAQGIFVWKKFVHCNSVVLTDLPSIVPNLTQNLEDNIEGELDDSNERSISVHELAW